MVPATLGFTNTPPAVVSGHVFLDANANGVQDSGDPNAPGMTITLSGKTDQGAQVSSQVTTDSNGDFRFFQVLSGTYSLTLGSSPNFTGPESIPGSLGGSSASNRISNITVAQGQAGLNYTFAFTGLNGSSVSLRNLLSSGGSGGASLPFAPAGSGSQAVDNTVQPSAKATAGTASLAGTVTNDANQKGVGSIQIGLTGIDSTGRDVFLITTTSSTGTYSFDKLQGGIYSLNVIAYPTGFHADEVTAAGASPGSSGGLELRNDQITNINLASGASGTGYNFGELALPMAKTSGTLSLSAALADDTTGPGGTAIDTITSDPSIAGQVQHSSAITSLQASFSTTFVSISDQLESDGTFYLNPAVLNQIAGSALANGANTLHLKATDASGNTVSFDVSFTLAETAPAIPTLQIQNTPPQVTVGSSTERFTVNFQTDGAEPTMTANGAGLTGTGASVTVATTVPGTAGNPAVQTITFQGTITGGTFTLTFNGATTGPIAWDPNPTTLTANIQAAVNLLRPPQVTAGLSAGTFTATFSVPGVEPTMTADGTLLQGTGATVSVATTTAGNATTAAVQSITFGGTITGGTFTLTLNGATTAAINWDPNATNLTNNIQTALNALTAQLNGNQVAFSGSPSFTATFQTLGVEPTMTANGAGLTGSGVNVTVVTTVPGVQATTAAVQTIVFQGPITGGTFTLTFNGATTGPISWDPNPATLTANIQTALNLLAPPQVKAGLTAGTFTATFSSPGAEPTMTAVGSNLTGTGASVSVATTTPGNSTTAAVQTITFNGTISGGTFTLTLNGATTGPITWASDAATLAQNIQSALDLLTGNLTGTQIAFSGSTTSDIVTFGFNGAQNTMTANTTSLSGSNPLVGVATTTAGTATSAAVQTITFPGSISGGTFTLTFNGNTTAPILWSSNPTTLSVNIQDALDELFQILNTPPQIVPGSSTERFTVGFAATGPEPTMTANGTNLTGTGASVSVATTVTGITATRAAVQTITFQGNITGGSFTLTFNGAATGAIAWNPNPTILATNIQSALNLLVAPAVAAGQTAGTFIATFPSPGVEPTMGADGTNLIGTGASVSVATTTAGTNNSAAVQTITFSGTITGGTFTLTLNGATTAAINWDANFTNLTNNIQNALNALTGQLNGNQVTFAGDPTFTASFQTNGVQPTITANSAGLSGAGASVTVVTTVAGTGSTPAIQTITFHGNIIGGTFTLTYNGATTAPITWDANPVTLSNNIQAALNLLEPPTVAAGQSAGTFTATFQSPGAEPTMAANGTGLTGTGASVTVNTTTAGNSATAAVQTITFGATVTGGTFTLTLNGATTGTINWDPNATNLAQNIQTALNTLTGQLNGTQIAFSGSTTSEIATFSFNGAQSTMTINGTSLAGTSVAVGVTTTTPGTPTTPAVQTITFSGNITGGTFFLGFGNATTGAISWSPNAATLATNIQSALNELFTSLSGSAHFANVAGKTSPNDQVTLTQGTNTPVTTTADAGGNFSFGVTLQGGANSFTVQATDNAGNASQLQTVLVNPIALNNGTAQTATVNTAIVLGNTVTVSFQGSGVEPTMAADATNLTGTGAGITVATTTAGTGTSPAAQTITFQGAVTGGTFTLTFNGATTGAISWDPNPATLAANIQAALNLLAPPQVAAGQSAGTFTATFTSPGAKTTMTANGAGLTGTGASVNVTTTTPGGTNTAAVQTITFGGTINSGSTFTLTLFGATTGAISWDPNAATLAQNIQTALNQLTAQLNGNQVAVASSTSNDQTFDLDSVFTDPNVTNSLITFNTSAGPINVQLDNSASPLSVANFFNYINSGAYSNDLFHRLATNPMVLQGGGFTLLTNPNLIVPVSVNPEIANEFGTPGNSLTDTVGTIAMAKQGGNPNSATSQFFFNTGNNATSLGSSNNGGFTVFGNVVSGEDMRVLNTLAAYPVVPEGPQNITVSFTNTGPEPTLTATSSLQGTKAGIQIQTNSPGTTATTAGSTSFQATNSVQTITFAGTITGGSFKLNFNGATTDAINWNPDFTKLAANIQTALNNIAGVSVTVAKTPNSSSPSPLTQLPLKNFSGTFPGSASASNFALIDNVATVQRSDHLTYTILSNDNPGAVAASIDANDWLQVHPLGTATATAHITVQAEDQFGDTATVTYAVTVSDPVSITNPGNQPAAHVGDKISVPITASTTATGTKLTYTATGLPAGLTIDPSTGIISGTIADSAANGVQQTYTVNVTATGGTSSASTGPFTWQVNPVITFASATTNQANTEGDTNISVQVPTASDIHNGKTLTYSATGLPAGLTIASGTGKITGTVSAGDHTNSPYTVVVTASDGTDSATETFTWTINPAVAITPTGDQTNLVGNVLSGASAVQVQATDANSKTLTYSATGLPGGLKIDPTSGLISGTIASGDDHNSPYHVTVTVKDGTNSNSENFTWTVTPIVTIAKITDQVNDDGATITPIQVSAQDGVGKALSYSASGLPTGLSISLTGVISGTIDPAADAHSPYTVTVTVTDQVNTSHETFTWTVHKVVTISAIAQQTNKDGDQLMGQTALQVSAQDANHETLTYSDLVNNQHTLPPGLTINSSGLITGTIDMGSNAASVNSPYHVTITVTDQDNNKDTVTFTWIVNPNVTITQTPTQTNQVGNTIPAVLPQVAVGQGTTFTATFPVPGAEPTMVANGNNLTGGGSVSVATTTPGNSTTKAVQTITFTGTITGGTFTLTFGGVTTAPITWSSTAATLASNIQTALDAIAVTVTVSDLNSATRFSATGLPAGLSINPTTGVISGTIARGADKNSPYSVSITVTDKGETTSETFKWTVNPAVMFTTTISNQTDTVGSSLNLPVAASDGFGKTLTFSATGLPASVMIDPHTGSITGTLGADANVLSPYTITVRASDGTYANKFTFTLTVNKIVTITAIPTQTNKDGDTLTAGQNALQVSAQDATNGAILTYTATGLPPGLMINQMTGAIIGTIDSGVNAASVGSPYTVTVTVKDQNNNSNQITFTWDVNPVVKITPISNQTNSVGNTIPALPPAPQVVPGQTTGTFIATFPVFGAQTTMTANGNGLSGTGAGVGVATTTPGNATTAAVQTITFSGTINAGSTFTLTLDNVTTAAISWNANTATLAGNIQAALEALGVQADVSDLTSDTKFSATGLPAGLSINPATGVISGTIASGANVHSPHTVTVTVTDQGVTGTTTFTWTVNPVVSFTKTVGDQTSVLGAAVPANLQATATDGLGLSLSYAITGEPAGVTIDNTGLISGSITNTDATGPYHVTVTARDSNGNSNHFTFTWTVNPVVTISALGTQTRLQGATLTGVQVVSAQDANSTTLSYGYTGLPTGLTFDAGTGLVSGTITATPGSYTVTATATDTNMFTNSTTFTWVVTPVVTITKINNQSDAAGTSLSLQVHAHDANSATLTYNDNSTLPPGLSIDPSSGLISGKIAAGDHGHTYHVTITVSDGTNTAQQTFTWTVT